MIIYPPTAPKVMSDRSDSFATAVIRWQKKRGRHNLPWQINPDFYHVWLSEVMLQQTQVATVIPYFERFIRRWSNVAALARARQDTVMSEWSGLGYYARARNLHAAAKIMHRDGIPQNAADWQKIPGVGKSTAAAIAVFTNGERAAILDGNVKRVLARVFAVDIAINTPAGEKILWRLAESLLPNKRHIRPYTQGLMDLGATVCARSKPQCQKCPLTRHCRAYQQNKTDSFPHRRAAPIRPAKTVYMAFIQCRHYVFLEKRPPSGIWGNLWSLPESSSAALLKKSLAQQLPCSLIAAGSGQFFHTFTHYHLKARVSHYHCRAAPLTRQWRNISQIKKTALPAPIKKYLLAHCEN